MADALHVQTLAEAALSQKSCACLAIDAPAGKKLTDAEAELLADRVRDFVT